MTPPETPVDALAEALAGIKYPPTKEVPPGYYVHDNERYAAAILAALTELGWSVERVREVERLRAAAKADADTHACLTPGCVIRASLRAVLRGGPDATD